MSQVLIARKKPCYRTLRKRLKARERTIQRLRNKLSWLELQLTLHFVEDRRAERDDGDVGEDYGDDCAKCKQLRNMLDTSVQLHRIAEWGDLAESLPDTSLAQYAQQDLSNAEGHDGGDDVKVKIDPSHISVQVDQHSEASRVPLENPGIFGQQSSGNLYCAIIVAVAILLVSWF
ncbi:uncharacterized protein [Montipora foliosa]|uniref:uncharacterized protein n=1 Tax=Montipora foliosa TaxID=591990 RepID=UPI0035F17093